MLKLDNKPLSYDRAFSHDGIQYPANWLRLASLEERNALGITEVADAPSWDQRFAWGYADDGTLIWKEHSKLVELWTSQVRITAGTMISPTDWMVVREVDSGVPMTDDVKIERQRIRDLSDQKVLEIEATTTTEELANYIKSPSYSVWTAHDEITPESDDFPFGDVSTNS